jgi:hypothetical protein
VTEQIGLQAEEHHAVRRELGLLLRAAALVSAEVADEVELVLERGQADPLTPEELERLLTTVVTVVQRRAADRGDEVTARALGDVPAVVRRILDVSARVEAAPPAQPAVRVGPYNGIQPRAVAPTPVFHGRSVPMDQGFVRTRDIQLWERNERLEIHLAQFRQREGRSPSSAELLDIMLSRMDLPGIPSDKREDQFEIEVLARSIAVNGVQKPPILAWDGRLLDGNRRVAACQFILHADSEEFTPDERKRAEHVFVWQLTEHATKDLEEAVVVALNFEPDHKEPWPEYVKARKVHDEWQAMLALEPRSPNGTRQAELKRLLSTRFALGPDTHVVNRYLKMVEWASDFEDFHITERKRDRFEVKHAASRYFQYFDELAKGERSGVARALQDDDNFRHLVYDLLFQGKFSNWRQIRDLKLINKAEDAIDELRKARDAHDPEAAETHIDSAISIARGRDAETRTLGANTRIETFVKWLEELPVNAFRDQIRSDVLQRLLGALELVQAHAAAALERREDA